MFLSTARLNQRSLHKIGTLAQHCPAAVEDAFLLKSVAVSGLTEKEFFL